MKAICLLMVALATVLFSWAPAWSCGRNGQAAVEAPAMRPIDPSSSASNEFGDRPGSLPVFRWPVRGPARGKIIVGCGGNNGVDIAVPEGTPIEAAEDGVVAYAGNYLRAYGNLVLVRHANGYDTAYAHASRLLVKRGDRVKRGQVIALAGQTGSVSSPRLHFEVRKDSMPVDPFRLSSRAGEERRPLN